VKSRHDENRAIVISGTSGAGKTSLVRKTAELMGDASCLHFDDYSCVSVYPTDLAAWMAAGADPDEWRTPQFAADLRALREGRAISLPKGKGVVQPQPYIMVEEPFGRSRREIAPSIDYVVYLDLPLDVAMLRKIRRETESYIGVFDEPSLSHWLTDFCARYLEGPLRETYLAANEKARAGADLVLDALRPLDELAEEIVRRVG
jgi:uridine kinase